MKRHTVLCLVFVFCCYLSNLATVTTALQPTNINERMIVTTGLGKIRGNVLESRLGNLFFAFRGIRYAKAPVDQLRFKTPEPVEQWDGVFEATEDGPRCPQPSEDENDVSEDCLRLNVYTRDLSSNSRKPVIFYIHPGGFYAVSGQSKNFAGPQHLMDRDIVLVTLNYRLGALGFLSTGTEESPGNNGLKDQVVALRWVRNHISKFGGDPGSVTIMGYSAGGWSVSLHMVSPMSRGLFHRAIVMSGAATSQWDIPYDQIDIAKRQARVLNCSDETISEIISCLQNKTAIELGNSLQDMFEFDGMNPILVWSPVIEHDFGQERFLTDDPTKLFRLGRFARIPVLAGITKYEFLDPAVSILSKEETRLQMDYNFEELAPICFMYERGTQRSKDISKRLRKEFLSGASITNHSLTGLNNLFADGVIGFAMYRFVRLANVYTKVYQYQFSYTGRYSHTNFPGDKPYGAVHHDDLLYLFHVPVLTPMFKEDDEENLTIERITRLWTNFATRGDPNRANDEFLRDLRWRPMSSNRFNYLDIGDELVIKDQLNAERYEIWRELFPISTRRRDGKSEVFDYEPVDDSKENGGEDNV